MLRYYAFYWNIGCGNTVPIAEMTSRHEHVLMYAAAAGDLETARLLLENGVAN